MAYRAWKLSTPYTTGGTKRTEAQLNRARASYNHYAGVQKRQLVAKKSYYATTIRAADDPRNRNGMIRTSPKKGGKKKTQRPQSAGQSRAPLAGERSLDSLINGGIDARGQRVLVPQRRPASAGGVRSVDSDESDEEVNRVPEMSSFQPISTDEEEGFCVPEEVEDPDPYGSFVRSVVQDIIKHRVYREEELDTLFL